MNLKLIGARWVILVLVFLPLALQAEPGRPELESQVSMKDYAQTVVALRKTLNRTNAKIFQEIDHRNTAVGMDIELPPSRVFSFGNPRVDAGLMECAPLVAVDLPMRMLVREDGDGQTRLYWTRATRLMARHSGPPGDLSQTCHELALKVDATLAEIAREAAEQE